MGLRRQIEYVVEALSARGLSPTARIATLLPEGPEMSVALIAVAAGAVCAPLNPACHVSELSFYLNDLNAKALLIEAGNDSPVVDAARDRGMTILELVPQEGAEAGLFSLAGEGQEGQGRHGFNRPNDKAFVLYTSGTTARPRLVPLTHRHICVSAYNIRNVLGLTEADRCLAVMPFFHIHGLSTIFASLAAGGSIVCPSGFSASTFFELLETFDPTWYSAAPTIHQVILENAAHYPKIIEQAELRFIRSASGPMVPQVRQELERLFQAPLIEAYGMTEASPQIASNRLPPSQRKAGSVGQAAGPEIRIVDEAGNPMGTGESGEIVIRGANVMCGYENNPVANQNAFVNGWLRTGDLGYLDADGYLFISGRLKEIINRGGEKISPRQVEEVLLEHPAIAQAITFAIPHSVLGETVAAAIVLKQGFESSESGEIFHKQLIQVIREFLAKRLTYFKVPQEIVIVDEIPKCPRGKIQRLNLGKTLEVSMNHDRLLRTGVELAIPPASIEGKLVGIWSAVLRIDSPGIDDNFFNLGGHSLTVTQVINRIRETFQVDLPLESLFEKPTVAGLAKLIARAKEKRTEKQPSLPSAEQSALATIQRQRVPGPFSLSFAQQRLWFLDQLENSNAYNMSIPLWLSGPLDVATLERSLNEIRCRHETLRTSFQIVGGQSVQVITEAEETALPIIDLTILPSSERKSEALRLTAEEADHPFNLAGGRLLRTKLLRLGSEEHLLLLTMHHIIADGWSTKILHREIGMLYAAFLAGQSAPLSELPIQYSDYALWQRQWLQGEMLEKQVAYWKQQLRDAPPLLALANDRPRPAIQTHRGARLPLAISRATTEGLKALALKEGATLFMTTLAAFKLLLSRYTGEQDIIVGTPIANRLRLETEDLIGFFANTLVLRSDLSGDHSFRELLARVRTTAREAYAHQDLPFEKLVEELQPERDLSRVPLFQIVFAFQNLPEAGATAQSDKGSIDGAPFELAPGLMARPFKGDRATSKFDLTLYLAETGQGLIGAWQYNTDLFEAKTIERLDRNFQTLLNGIAVGPDWHLSDLPLLDEVERYQLEVEWNQTQAHHPIDRCFHHLFEQQVERTPDAVALEYGDEHLTYKKLNEQANQLARHLQVQGVGAETLVGILLTRSAEMLVAVLGVLKSGGAYLPLDPEYPAARIAFMVKDARVSFLVTEKRQHALVEAIFEDSGHSTAKLVCLDADWPAISQESRENPESGARGDNLAYVIYTSGSTGRPKGVAIAHGNLSHYVQAMQEAVGITSGDRYLHTASLAFSSSVRQFAVPLSCGATVHVAPADKIRDPQALINLIQQREVTVLDTVPSYWRSCIQVLQSIEPASRAILRESKLRLVLSASEPLAPDLPREWYAGFNHGVQLINMFGQTETTGIVTTYPIPVSGLATEKLVPVGRPIANTRVYILDRYRQSVPVGVVGEVYIGGAGVGRGYLNLPELTEERFVPDPFTESPAAKLYRTGDRAKYLSDGNIEFVGRVDNQIKVRGFRVEPEEIEVVIRKHPLVQETAVVAYTTQSLAGEEPLSRFSVSNNSSQRLAAFVVFKEPVEPVKSSEGSGYQRLEPATTALRVFLRQELPDYLVPSIIVELESLPLTPNGKLDRQALSQKLAPNAQTRRSQGIQQNLERGFVAPRTPAEKILAAAWQDVLGVERVGIDDNFFDLGGDSILSIEIVLRANQAGLQLSLKQLFQYQTVAELARSVAANGTPFGSDWVAASSPSENVDNVADALDESSPDEVEPAILVSVEKLRAYGREALEQAGLLPEGAAIVTEVQLESSLRGQQTHNMRDIPRYARRLVSGLLNPRPKIRIERETNISALIDGDNGPGQWVATVAMETAIKKAKESGVGIVGVRRSNHFGAAAQYVWMATQEELIGLCTTNGPLILAPTGGVTPTFGNNPLGVGLPAGSAYPVILDIAMSVAPRGKIGLQLAEGKPLAPGWIFDRLGCPSMDLADLAAGLGVPIGRHKGYGLAFVFEGLAGALTGAGFCWDHDKDGKQSDWELDLGHLFIAIDPELFIPLSEFKTRVDRMVKQTKTGERAEGVKEILIPGESEMKARERNLRNGVPLRASTYRTLLEYAKKAGLNTNVSSTGLKDSRR